MTDELNNHPQRPRRITGPICKACGGDHEVHVSPLKTLTTATATARLQRWEDWAFSNIAEDSHDDVKRRSATSEADGGDPNEPLREALTSAFWSAKLEMVKAMRSAAALEDLARHYKAEVDSLRAAVEEMLLSAGHTDAREAIHEAAARVGAFIDSDTIDSLDERVVWRQHDRKDGDA